MTRFSDRMERIREDLIRRAHADRTDAMERGTAGHEEPPQVSATEHETQQRKKYNTRLEAMFSRPVEFMSRRAAATGMNARRVESPKSPNGEEAAMRNRENETTTSYTMGTLASVREPAPAVVPGAAPPGPFAHQQDSHRSRLRGSSSRSSKVRNDANKRFLFCFPWISSGRVRVVAMHCFTSGLFVLLLVAVYLGLTLTQHIATNELTILLLLIILISTVFFCYNIVRLCLTVVRGDKGSSHSESRRRHAAMNTADTLKTGYAMPRRPIRVVLAQDEDVVGREAERNKAIPPAYGLWRESVKRLDPNQLRWQRNTAARLEQPVPEEASAHEGGNTARRPPSYASEDGVSYVIDAMATSGTSSTVPRTEPGEHGRAR